MLSKRFQGSLDTVAISYILEYFVRARYCLYTFRPPVGSGALFSFSVIDAVCLTNRIGTFTPIETFSTHTT